MRLRWRVPFFFMQAVSATPANANATQTVTAEERTDGAGKVVLKLKTGAKERDRKITWTEDTIDNEHLDKKKSKCCCIYDPPPVYGDVSSGSDSDDSDPGPGHAHGGCGTCKRQARAKKRRDRMAEARKEENDKKGAN